MEDVLQFFVFPGNVGDFMALPCGIKETHEYSNFISNIYVANVLIDMRGKFASLDDAK